MYITIHKYVLCMNTYIDTDTDTMIYAHIVVTRVHTGTRSHLINPAFYKDTHFVFVPWVTHVHSIHRALCVTKCAYGYELARAGFSWYCHNCIYPSSLTYHILPIKVQKHCKLLLRVRKLLHRVPKHEYAQIRAHIINTQINRKTSKPSTDTSPKIQTQRGVMTSIHTEKNTSAQETNLTFSLSRAHTCTHIHMHTYESSVWQHAYRYNRHKRTRTHTRTSSRMGTKCLSISNNNIVFSMAPGAASFNLKPACLLPLQHFFATTAAVS